MKIKRILQSIFLAPAFMMFGVAGAGGASQPDPANAGSTNPEDPQQNSQGDQSQDTGKEEKVFTQAEVNALMAKEKDQGRRAILKELGVTDVKSAKDGLENYKKYLESQKTELQKAQDAAGQAEKDKINLQAELQASNQKLAVLMAGCASESVNDVCVLAQSRVTETVNFEQAVEQVKKEYPSMFSGEPQNSKGTGGNANPQNKGTGKTVSSFGQRLASAHKFSDQENPYFKA